MHDVYYSFQKPIASIQPKTTGVPPQLQNLVDLKSQIPTPNLNIVQPQILNTVLNFAERFPNVRQAAPAPNNVGLNSRPLLHAQVIDV